MRESRGQKVEIPLPTRKRLGDCLLEASLITFDHLKIALDEQKRLRKRLGETLLALKIISESHLARGLSAQLGYPFLDLKMTTIDPDGVMAVSESLARRYLAMPVVLKSRSLTVAMADPLDYEAVRDLGFSTGLQVIPAIATSQDVLEAIERYYPPHLSAESIVKETVQEVTEETLHRILPEIRAIAVEARSLEERSHLAPVIRLVNLIITRGIKQRASDIHIEPGAADFRVRYRIDGLLKEDLRLPKWIHGAVVSRIKILARLDIAERRMPQDGGFRIRADECEPDLRISALPTQHGEKVVIRILDQGRIAVSLDALGLCVKDLIQVQSFLQRKQGIVLLTGPTGSGKTTTLYAMIQALKSETKNIVTVEDPIEYSLEEINQVQVHPEIGLTFATCLRSILRQDPNVILIGEIRDLETAEIAIRAAMTGHLVLSTLHTNDAPATITRLLDIGIPRYLVASSLIGVIAQRLVRCICSRCKIAAPASDEGLASLRIPSESVKTTPFYHGKGCPSCNYLGYYGRIGLFEMLEITPPLRELISGRASEQDLRSVALAAQMRSLWEDGLEKLKEGITTLDELLRVVEIP